MYYILGPNWLGFKQVDPNWHNSSSVCLFKQKEGLAWARLTKSSKAWTSRARLEQVELGINEPGQAGIVNR